MKPTPETAERDRLEPAGTVEHRLRLAGRLMLAGSICAVPATLALDPLPPPTDYLIPGVGMAGALVLLAAPASWASPAWIHVAIIATTAVIATGVAAVSDDYAFFYALVAVYAAYALDRIRTQAAYIALLVVALMLPLAHVDDTREQLHHILVTLPVLVIAPLIVIDLRRALADRERAYRGFAAEATALTTRIRRTSTRPASDERSGPVA